MTRAKTGIDAAIERPARCPPRGHMLRMSGPLAAAIAGAALLGCAEFRNEGYAKARGQPASASARSAKSTTPPARMAMTTPLAAREQNVPLPQRVLAAENEARFVVLPDTEVVGRSRTYTGAQSTPDSCAAQCLASKGCDAFSFSKETRVCYLVTQITQSNPDSAFVSGRLR